MSSGREEVLLWTLLHRFETDTLERYLAHVPALATTEKRRLIEELGRHANSDAFNASELARPIGMVLEAARSGNAEETLFVQGFVFELLGRAIYAAAEQARGLSAEDRAVAEQGRKACEQVVQAAGRCARDEIGTGEAAFAAFAAASHEVLGALDAIGDPVDRIFGERIDTCFAEMMGEFTADLLEACMTLGMERRRVIGHLAGASMGF